MACTAIIRFVVTKTTHLPLFLLGAVGQIRVPYAKESSKALSLYSLSYRGTRARHIMMLVVSATKCIIVESGSSAQNPRQASHCWRSEACLVCVGFIAQICRGPAGHHQHCRSTSRRSRHHICRLPFGQDKLLGQQPVPPNHILPGIWADRLQHLCKQ